MRLVCAMYQTLPPRSGRVKGLACETRKGSGETPYSKLFCSGQQRIKTRAIQLHKGSATYRPIDDRAL